METYLLRRGVLTVEIVIILLLVSVKVVLVTRSIPRIPRIWIPRVSSSVVWILVVIPRILKIICGLSGRIWVFNSIFLVIIARTLVIIVEITIVFVFICEIIVWISATFIGIYGWWRLKRVIFLSIIKASQKGHFKKLDFFKLGFTSNIDVRRPLLRSHRILSLNKPQKPSGSIKSAVLANSPEETYVFVFAPNPFLSIPCVLRSDRGQSQNKDKKNRFSHHGLEIVFSAINYLDIFFWQGTGRWWRPPQIRSQKEFFVFFKGCKGGLGAQDVWPPWCYCCNFPRTSYVLSRQRRQPHPPVYIEESQIPSYCSSALRGSNGSRNESSPTLLKCLGNRIDETCY